MSDWPVRVHDGASLLTVRVTPKSSRDAVEGVETDDAGRSYLKLRVRAVPAEGAANKAVCQLIAKWLGLPKSAVSLHAGDTARIKHVFVDLPTSELEEQLESL